MSAYPTASRDLEQFFTSAPAVGLQLLETSLPDGLKAHANVAVRNEASHLVVFLPGAQSPKSQRRIPFFHRWTWQEDLPEAHVIALSDPVIALDERLLGGWFMHPRVDVVNELALLIGRIADQLHVPHDRITFHGSSLGGFGAIGMAAHLPGARAVSEIPQIDVAEWPIPSAIRLLEELVSAPLGQFRQEHPERVCLADRIRYAKHIPDFTLITNTSDPSYDSQAAFMDDVSADQTCSRDGEQRLVLRDDTSGHQPLPKADALSYLRPAGR